MNSHVLYTTHSIRRIVLIQDSSMNSEISHYFLVYAAIIPKLTLRETYHVIIARKMEVQFGVQSIPSILKDLHEIM